jgi:hypothetical protein
MVYLVLISLVLVLLLQNEAPHTRALRTSDERDASRMPVNTSSYIPSAHDAHGPTTTLFDLVAKNQAANPWVTVDPNGATFHAVQPEPNSPHSDIAPPEACHDVQVQSMCARSSLHCPHANPSTTFPCIGRTAEAPRPYSQGTIKPISCQGIQALHLILKRSPMRLQVLQPWQAAAFQSRVL